LIELPLSDDCGHTVRIKHHLFDPVSLVEHHQVWSFVGTYTLVDHQPNGTYVITVFDNFIIKHVISCYLPVMNINVQKILDWVFPDAGG